MTLTIIIKALNEEKHIRRAIQSALFACSEINVSSEVFVVDSISDDNTVSIAAQYPIRIFQILHKEDRSCGIGAQLGFLLSGSEFIYILDGDMELQPGFLGAALRTFEAHPRLAGVAGLVEEKVIANSAFALRASKGDTATPSTSTTTLNMGGLYRSAAIHEIGYLTNRNLHSFEEFDLGARLVSAGWRLTRIPVPAISHFGPTTSSLALLWRRWSTRYACGHGELFRAAIGKPHFGLVVRELRVLRVQFSTVLLWLALALTSGLFDLNASETIMLFISAWGSVFMFLASTRRSFRKAAYSVIAWHVGVAGFLRGIFTAPAQAPSAPIPFRVIK